MIDEALRHPDLRPIPQPRISNVAVPSGEPPDSLGFILHTSVANFGDRISKALMIEWLVPVYALRTAFAPYLRSVDGDRFAFWENSVLTANVVWPNEVPVELPQYVGLRADVNDCTMLLRFYDDVGTYPRGGYYRFRYHREPDGNVSLAPDGMLVASTDAVG